MNIKNVQIAAVSAVIIGSINLLSMGAVYVVFSGKLKSSDTTQTASTSGNNQAALATGASTDAETADGTETVATTDETTPAATTPTTGAATATGTAAKPAATTTKASGAAPTKPSAPTGGGGGVTVQPPNPALACTAITSFNNIKEGNPNWDPNLVQTVKNGVYSDSRTKIIGGPDKVWAGMKISDLGACSGGSPLKVQGKFGYGNFGQATIFTVTWMTNKWVVTYIQEVK